MTRKLTIPVAPVAKPRMTQRDKWKTRPAVQRYRDFCDNVRMAAMAARFTMPPAGAHMVFHIPMPASWTKKKRAAMNMTAHQQKPDLDNLVKALADALMKDDSGLWSFSAEKRWAVHGRVEIEIREQGVAA